MGGVSEVSIANRAVQLLGSSSRIASLDEDSPNARSLNAAYDPVRRRLLRSYPWSFAKKRASIAADSTQTTYGTLNRFQVPNDFIRLIRSVEPNDQYRPDWEIEGRFIVTLDASPIQFRYIFDETDPANFDPLFCEAFSHLLAYSACKQITGSTDERRQIAIDLKEVIQQARQANAFERDADLPPADDWIVAMLPGAWITPS